LCVTLSRKQTILPRVLIDANAVTRGSMIPGTPCPVGETVENVNGVVV